MNAVKALCNGDHSYSSLLGYSDCNFWLESGCYNVNFRLEWLSKFRLDISVL